MLDELKRDIYCARTNEKCFAFLAVFGAIDFCSQERTLTMGLTWNENYATIFNSKTWSASVEGYKITNVFGLAWNYYVAYTKFITGLDITLDMGLKCEFFFAKTYKIGYAPDTSFGVDKNNCSPICRNMYAGLQSMVTTQQEVVGIRNAVIDAEVVAVEERLSVVSVDSEERDSLTSVTSGTELRSSSELMWEGLDGNFDFGASFSVTSSIISLNDGALEVL